MGHAVASRPLPSAECLRLGAVRESGARATAAATPLRPRLCLGDASTARRLIASGASGLADRARGRALTIDDPARIASVTKLVVALGVMRMVEQGRLDLDRDVSDYLGWRLRNPAFPDRPITLRLLLSHRSSLRDEIDYAIPLGTTLRAGAGRSRRLRRRRIRPAPIFRYSNLNFPVIASVMERVSGERFDRLMERLVLRPLGLDACFNWTTCSDAAIGRAVVLYAPDGRGAARRSRRAAARLPGAARRRAAISPPIELGSNGALFSPQGGLAHLGARSRHGRPAAAQRRLACRPAVPARGEPAGDVRAGLALRRQQRRHRKRLLLRLWARRAEPAGRAGGLPRRSVRRRGGS